MANPDGNNIELEVRRVLAAQELQVRQQIADELREQRQFLQAQFKTLALIIGVVLTIAGGAFTYLFGSSYQQIDNLVQRQVDQKVFEYRITENYKRQLEERVNAIIATDAVAARIRARVLEEVSVRLDERIDESILRKIEQVKQIDVEDLIQRAAGTELRDIRGDTLVAMKVMKEALEEASGVPPSSDLRTRLNLAECLVIDRRLDPITLTCSTADAVAASENSGTLEE